MPRTITALLLLLPTLLLLSARCAGEAPRPSPAAEEMLRDEVGFLIREATAWVEAQRDDHRPDGRRLAAEEKRRLAGFFPPEIGSYRGIAFEEQAFRLQRRFRADPAATFSVWDEVERRFGLEPADSSG